MQKDMHFYGVYTLARAAGIKREVATTIAYASQFVDDALYGDEILLNGNCALLPTTTAHKALDYENSIQGDQWRVWMPFHFLPGNNESDDFHERVICEKDSGNAGKICTHALSHAAKDYAAHIIGIVAHVYADTFSHYGFSGISSHRNKIDNNTLSILSGSSSIQLYINKKAKNFIARFKGFWTEFVAVGHGAVVTYPDRPYLKWGYKLEDGTEVERDNPTSFMEACEALFKFFSRALETRSDWRDSDKLFSWDEIKGHVETIIRFEGSKDERIDKWKEGIDSCYLFVADSDESEIEYDEEDWSSDLFKELVGGGIAPETLDLYKFTQAAQLHRDFVLREVLPDAGVLL